LVKDTQSSFCKEWYSQFWANNAVLCFNDSVGKKNVVLNMIGESGSKSVNAMKRIHTERTRKTEQWASQEKHEKPQGKCKEDHDGPGDPEYGAGKHYTWVCIIIYNHF
jgi:hypothetical protein